MWMCGGKPSAAHHMWSFRHPCLKWTPNSLPQVALIRTHTLGFLEVPLNSYVSQSVFLEVSVTMGSTEWDGWTNIKSGIMWDDPQNGNPLIGTSYVCPIEPMTRTPPMGISLSYAFWRMVSRTLAFWEDVCLHSSMNMTYIVTIIIKLLIWLLWISLVRAISVKQLGLPYFLAWIRNMWWIWIPPSALIGIPIRVVTVVHCP